MGYKVEKNNLAGDASRQGEKKKLECAEEDNMDPPINTECFHSGGGTTMIFIVTGAKSVLAVDPAGSFTKETWAGAIHPRSGNVQRRQR